jgi:hypothetical protein
MRSIVQRVFAAVRLVAFLAPALGLAQAPFAQGAGASKAPSDEPGAISAEEEYVIQRDPFVNPTTTFIPPKGIAEMRIDQVKLSGFAEMGSDRIAIVQGVDNKIYFLRVGAKLADGTLSAIDNKAGQAVFTQDISDPTSPVKTRKVVRSLEVK